MNLIKIFILSFSIIGTMIQADTRVADLTRVGSFSFYVPTLQEIKDYGKDYLHYIKGLFTGTVARHSVVLNSPWIAHHATKYIPTYPCKLLVVGGYAPALLRKLVSRLASNSTVDIICHPHDELNAFCKETTTTASLTVHYTWTEVITRIGYYDQIIITTPLSAFELEHLDSVLKGCTTVLKQYSNLIYLLPAEMTATKLLFHASTVSILEWINKMIVYVDNALIERHTRALSKAEEFLKFLFNWHVQHFTEINTEFIPLNIAPYFVVCLQKN